METNLFKIINDWLKQYEPVGSWLYFNSTPVELGATSMNTLPSSQTKEYIDGSKDVTLSFTVNMVREYDSGGTSDINTEALDESCQFANWIKEQNDSLNYPEFGDKMYVKEIKVLSTVPSLAVNQTAQLAQYSFNARLVYRDEREVI